MARDRKKEYEWNKENKVFIGLSLMRSTDSDIIGYLDKEISKGKSRQGVIKEALREKISRETYAMMDRVAEYTPEYED